MSRRLVRRIKSINASPAQVKIKSATSNDAFGPTTKELNEIAILTLTPASNKVMTEVIRKRIQDNSWRHILKCLTVVEYCLLVGSLEFVQWLRENKHLVATLKEYSGQNEEVSQQIRNKAKTIMKLVADDKILKTKRENFHVFRNQMSTPAVGKRSSLDITRESNNEVCVLTDDVPQQFRRGTQSFELVRNSEQDNASSNGSRVQAHEVTRLLADIIEE